MTNMQIQLDALNLPSNIIRHTNLFSINNLNLFIDQYILKLIQKYGISQVQKAIDNDSNPYDPIINYITCITEIGMLHELFYQSFASENTTVLNERMEYLAWAINISIANTLKSKGLIRIPSIANGLIHIYFTWDNMKIIIQRIRPRASQFVGAVPHEVEAYLNNLIQNNL